MKLNSPQISPKSLSLSPLLSKQKQKYDSKLYLLVTTRKD